MFHCVMQNEELQRYPWLLLYHPSPLLSVMWESKRLILKWNIPRLAHLNHLLPNMKHWRGLKELHDCTSQQWGYTKKTPTQQNWTFVSQAFEHAITLPCSPQFSLYWEGWVQRGVCGSWAARAMWDKGTCWLNWLDFDCRSCVWGELRAEWR